MPEFRHNGRRNKDLREKLMQNIDLPNQDQIIQGRGIGDDHRTAFFSHASASREVSRDRAQGPGAYSRRPRAV